MAVAWNASLPTSTVTVGFFTRLRYQSGSVSAPDLDAKTTRSPPARRYIIGLVYERPDVRPVVVRSSTGAPSKFPPTLPSLARNCAMTLAFQSFTSGTLVLRVGGPGAFDLTSASSVSRL